MRVAVVVLAGIALGVLSRIEEVEPFDLQVSSHPTWLAAAFVAGLIMTSPLRGALAGLGLLTVANGAYYVYVLVTEPGVPLESVAGSPVQWFVLGVGAGGPLGAAGVLCRSGARPPVRLAALALLPIVVAADAIDAFSSILP
jgi:hypothetical protein